MFTARALKNRYCELAARTKNPVTIITFTLNSS
jgi:hypothetical protein